MIRLSQQGPNVLKLQWVAELSQNYRAIPWKEPSCHGTFKQFLGRNQDEHCLRTGMQFLIRKQDKRCLRTKKQFFS